jgi:pyruvate formate-lyase activating enzyme-like uncharacterized protein
MVNAETGMKTEESGNHHMRLYPSIDRMPDTLIRILNETHAFQKHNDERVQTAGQWAHQVERLRSISANIQIEHSGDTVRYGELSPGCRACKSGQWDCLFLTMACNLSCNFCLTPCRLTQEGSLSAFGNDPDLLIEKYGELNIKGIGFSGGEPLLRLDRLLECLSTFRKRRPDLYCWAYTNGLLLTKDIISSLAEAGLHELRFNMAATGYFHSHVLSMLEYAARCLSSVTVEIPAIPEHAGLLRKAVPVWSRAGMKYLNLHELIYEAGSPSETMPGARGHCRMPDGHQSQYNPQSVELVAEVLNDIKASGLPISVNYCSLASKALQIRGRRRNIAAFTLKPYENMCESGEAESVCYFNDTKCEFAHAATLTGSPHRFAGYGVARLRRLLPLAPYGPSQWSYFEILREPGHEKAPAE